jgi:protein O-mannosyl-transferase
MTELAQTTPRPHAGDARSPSGLACLAARPAWISLLLAAATLLVYYPVGWFPFISLDDPIYVSSNPRVQAGLSLDGLTWALCTGHAGNWHPLTWLSHMLDAQLYGLQPAGPHITNLLFHVATTLLLFRLLHQLTGALWRSALVAALFALHPMHVESVAWISERKDVLSAFFFVLTLLAYLRYVKSAAAGSQQPVSGRNPSGALAASERPPTTEHRPQSPAHASRFTLHASGFYLLSLFCFALGLMSKPMLVTLPFVLLVVDFWPLRRMQNAEAGIALHAPRSTLHTPPPPLLPLLREKVPFFLLAALSSAVTFAVQRSGGAVMPTAELSLSGRIANALVGYVRYIEKLFWPSNLACFYPRPEHWPVWQVAGAALVLAVITALVLRLVARHGYLAVGWFWYLGTLVPVIGLVQVGEQAIADRYNYIPSIGLFVMAAWSLGDIACRWPRLKPVLCSASVIAVAALVVATRQQVLYWRTSETLFRHALAVTGDNPWVHCLLADTLADSGSFDEAEYQCREALRLKPGFPEIQVLYARVLERGKKLNQAAAVLSEVVQQNPADAAAQCALASVLSQKRDFAPAIQHYREALRLKPNYPEASFSLASALSQQGDASGAIAQYRAGLLLQPDSPDPLNNLAWILAANSNPAIRDGQEAVQLARRACDLTRYQRPMLVGTLAAAYAEAGRFDEAVAAAQKARDLALASQQQELADRNYKLLELYRTHQAYHEPSGEHPGREDPPK